MKLSPGTHPRLVVLTGAGVSVGAGIGPFRGRHGSWDQTSVTTLGTQVAFERQPHRVLDFLEDARQLCLARQPALGHHLLASWEQWWGQGFTLLTQNVDGLHPRAGSKRVLELHGSLHRWRCQNGHLVEGAPPGEPSDRRCPDCGAQGRPAVVLFGEVLPPALMAEAVDRVQQTDVLVVVGTSGTVWPVSALAIAARVSGAKTIWVNPVPPAEPLFDVVRCGTAEDVLPTLTV